MIYYVINDKTTGSVRFLNAKELTDNIVKDLQAKGHDVKVYNSEKYEEEKLAEVRNAEVEFKDNVVPLNYFKLVDAGGNVRLLKTYCGFEEVIKKMGSELLESISKISEEEYIAEKLIKYDKLFPEPII